MGAVLMDPDHFANESRLLAAFPVRKGGTGEPGGVYVVCERTDVPPGLTRDRWVSAWMRDLGHYWWAESSYHDTPERAIAVAMANAGWTSAALVATERYYTAQ